MIVQVNVCGEDCVNMVFICISGDSEKVQCVLEVNGELILFDKMDVVCDVVKVLVVGVGMKFYIGVVEIMFEVLVLKNINIDVILIFEIKILVLIDVDYIEFVVCVFYIVFDFDVV